MLYCPCRSPLSFFKPVARWHAAVIDGCRCVEHGQFSLGHPLDVGAESSDMTIIPNVFGVSVGE
jgi:hypothetical protein